MSLVLSRVFKTTLQQRHRQAHKRRRFSLFSLCTDCSLFLEGSLSDLHRAASLTSFRAALKCHFITLFSATFSSILLSTLVHFFHFHYLMLSNIIHSTCLIPPSHTVWYLFLVKKKKKTFMKDCFMPFIFFSDLFLAP